MLCWPLTPERPPDVTAERPSLRTAVAAWRSRSRSDLSGAVFAAVVQGLAPAIEAGVPSPIAVATAASIAARGVQDTALAAELEQLESTARAGTALAATWASIAQRYPDAGLEPVARAWSLSDRIGCGLNEALNTATDAMREQEDHRRRVAAATAGARATMTLLTGLPIAGVGICAVIGMNPVRLYAGGPGCIALVLGLLLLWAGRRIIREMIARSCAPGRLG